MYICNLIKNKRMKNLAGDKDANKFVEEELYIAGIETETCEISGEVPTTIVGKIGKWTLKRAWYYWVASVEKTDDGLTQDKAVELHEMDYPVGSDIDKIGIVIRSGGHCGCPAPAEYGASIPYPEFKYKDFPDLEKQYKEFENSYVGPKYVNCYHIDDQIGLNIFAKFIKQL